MKNSGLSFALSLTVLESKSTSQTSNLDLNVNTDLERLEASVIKSFMVYIILREVKDKALICVSFCLLLLKKCH